MNLHFFPNLKIISFIIVIACLAMILPSNAYAASTKLTCSVTATTNIGTTTKSDEIDVLLRKGDTVKLSWASTNAKNAFNGKGSIALSGSATSAPTTTTTYAYRFTNGSKKAECSITVHVVSATITPATLFTTSLKPTLSGNASGIKTVYVEVRKKGSSKVLYTSKAITIKKGTWKSTFTKKLAIGEYDVRVLGDKKLALNTIATGTLSISKEVPVNAKSKSTLLVKSIPLLAGGIARANGIVPVSYLQVVNTGKESATLNGFTLKQNGSAPVESVIKLTAADDSGLLQDSIEGSQGKTPFKDKTVFVPIKATFSPGQMRLFTLKAVLPSNVTAYIGKQLMIDVASVDATASLQGSFPIRGTTWTIGY